MDKKIEIYIDFEAITSNFLRRIFKNVPHNFEFPYIYTVGYYKNDDLILDTGYINLKKIWNLENLINQSKTTLKWMLTKSIRKITGIKNLEINSHNIDFLVWGNSLEDNIIEPMFGFKTKNIQKGSGISIDKVVPSKLFNENYFKKMEAIENQKALYKGSTIKLKPDFSSGAMCAVLGAILILNNFKNSYQHKAYDRPLNDDEKNIIIDCISQYNRDDVKKIAFIHKNSDKKEIIENQIYYYIWKTNKLRNEEVKLSKLKSILKVINNIVTLDKDSTVEYAVNKANEFFELEENKNNQSKKVFENYLPLLNTEFKSNSLILKNIKLNSRKLNKIKQEIKTIKEEILPSIADTIFGY
ncbi:hypothetical protein [Mycoplasma sp. OR1901]|uniref:hypothetical protein n=1 Tax=Mycoplasma sp. OR1901 TaxID=2742195 RepID=UPI001582B686|nr:hypothetical protein [Mycoplasma sp. OR1901]QKT05155.1 hypothetical protein HTZ87_00270 [Mycoplasma sp. OR1901]